MNDEQQGQTHSLWYRTMRSPIASLAVHVVIVAIVSVVLIALSR